MRRSGAELGRRVGRSQGFKRILSGKVAYPAPALLDRLEDVTALDLSAYRVPCNHMATLADVRASVSARLGEPHEVVRDLDRFARGLQRSLATVPALRAAIEPELADTDAHRRFGIKLPYDRTRGKVNTKRWSNFRRNLLRALEIHGTVAPAHLSWHLGAEWRALAELAKGIGKSAWAGISRLARVCDAAGIPPKDVNDDVVELLRDDLAADPKRFGRTEANNRQVVRNTIKRWNELANRFAGQGWPEVQLTPLPHAGWRFSTTTADLSPELHAALDIYVREATRPRPGESRYRPAPGGRAPEPLKPGTAEGHRRTLLTAAKSLIDAGHAEPATLTTLEQLVRPDAMTVILESLEVRHEAPNGPNRLERDHSAYAESFARRLCSIAARLGSLSEAELAKLDELGRAAKARERGYGVSAHNLERLWQFDDGRIRRFLTLHTTILTEVARERRRSGALDRALARRMMEGIALLVLRICPLRRANLGGLRWSQHFVAPGVHGSDGWLIIPAHQTKNGRPIERRVPPAAWRELERYMADAQPLLRVSADVENDFLFPSPLRLGCPIGLDHLSQLVADVIRKRLDVDLHLHLIRHLYAWILLREDPTALATVSRILDHASTTAGPAAHWRPATIATVERAVGLWLGWCAAQNRAPDMPDAEIMPTYIDWLIDARGFAATTLTRDIDALASFARVITLGHDFSWLRDLARRCKRSERHAPRPLADTRGRIGADRLEALGHRLMAEAQTTARPGIYAAIRYRDGLMLLLLARRAPRRRNMMELTVDAELRLDGNARLILPARATKAGRRHELGLEALRDGLEAWLNHWRPMFGVPCDNGPMWPSQYGGTLHAKAASKRIGDLTEHHLGVRTTMHAARHALATTLSDHRPDGVAVAGAVLQHAQTGTTARSYVRRADALAAQKRAAELLQKIE